MTIRDLSPVLEKLIAEYPQFDLVPDVGKAAIILFYRMCMRTGMPAEDILDYLLRDSAIIILAGIASATFAESVECRPRS
jgi:hypothetical protein